MSLLDFLFPKYCVNCKKIGSYLCPNCFTYISFLDTGVCVMCQRPAIWGVTHPVCRTKYGIDGVFSSIVYGGVAKKLVYCFKYKPYLTDLQGVMVDFFYEGLVQREVFMSVLPAHSFFVPVPLHKTRYKMRGYNQSQLLAVGLGKKLEVEVIDCLERIKNTKTQVGLTQAERRENIRDAFRLKESFRESLTNYKQAFIVDDVATSGATLREAAKILKRGGVAKVWGITLAHGQ